MRQTSPPSRYNPGPTSISIEAYPNVRTLKSPSGNSLEPGIVYAEPLIGQFISDIFATLSVERDVHAGQVGEAGNLSPSGAPPGGHMFGDPIAAHPSDLGSHYVMPSFA